MKFERVLSFFGLHPASESADLIRKYDDLRWRHDTLFDEHAADLAALSSARSVIGRMDDEIGMWRAKVRLLESEIGTRDAQIVDLTSALDALKFQLIEASGALEQANSQIAILQQQIREDETDEQLALMNAPASAEPVQTDDELIADTQQEVTYRLIGPWLDGGKHFWTFALGTLRITARILDKPFLDKMAKRDVFFAAGDAVRMTLRSVTFRKPGGDLYAKYSVERVLGIVPPEKQLDIPALATAAPEGVLS